LGEGVQEGKSGEKKGGRSRGLLRHTRLGQTKKWRKKKSIKGASLAGREEVKKASRVKNSGLPHLTRGGR